MSNLVDQPTGAPTRKITVVGVIGAAFYVVLAVKPELIALKPAVAPFLDILEKAWPAIMTVAGYSVAEWPEVEPAEPPMFPSRH